MASRNEMVFDIKSFKADTCGLSILEIGAYVMLLFEMHLSKDGWISETDLQKIARVGNAHWRTVRQALDKFFIVQNGKVTQQRIQRDRISRSSLKVDLEGKASAHNESKPLTSLLPSNSVISESSLSRTGVRSTKRQFPDGWRLSRKDEQFAIDRGLIYADEFEAFKDYHIAKLSRFLDWSAAWRTWCRNAVKFSKRGTINGKRSGSLSDAWDKISRTIESTEDSAGGENADRQLPLGSVRRP